MAHESLEWRFCDADDEMAWRQQTKQLADQAANQVDGSNWEETIHQSHKTRYFYELIFTIVLLNGVIAYLFWQHTDQKFAAVDERITALRHEAIEVQQNAIEHADSGAPLRLETAYLHFAASPDTLETVRIIAPRVDAQFQHLHQDFGLPLSPTPQKLKILVDQVTNATAPVMLSEYPQMGEQPLYASHPQFLVDRYGMSEADALTTELSGTLAEYLLEKAITQRQIKPQWQGMTLGLKTYVQLEYGFNRNWQSTEVFLAHRYEAQKRSLSSVHTLSYELDTAPEQGIYVHPTAFTVADTLVEFILVTYGYAKVPALLDAFEKHDSWTTLAPAVFYLSAADFEAQWHAYLRQHYPNLE